MSENQESSQDVAAIRSALAELPVETRAKIVDEVLSNLPEEAADAKKQVVTGAVEALPLDVKKAAVIRAVETLPPNDSQDVVTRGLETLPPAQRQVYLNNLVPSEAVTDRILLLVVRVFVGMFLLAFTALILAAFWKPQQIDVLAAIVSAMVGTLGGYFTGSLSSKSSSNVSR